LPPGLGPAGRGPRAGSPADPPTVGTVSYRNCFRKYSRTEGGRGGGTIRVGTELTPMAVDLGRLTVAVGSKDRGLLARLTRKFAARLAEIDAEGDDLEDEVAGGKRVNVAELEDRGAAFYRLLRETAMATGRTVADLNARPTKQLRAEAAALEKLMDFDLPQSDDEPREVGKPRATAADALRHLVMGGRRDPRVGFKYVGVFRCLCRHYGRELKHDRWCDLRRGSAWLQELDGVPRGAGAVAVGPHAPAGPRRAGAHPAVLRVPRGRRPPGAGGRAGAGGAGPGRLLRRRQAGAAVRRRRPRLAPDLRPHPARPGMLLRMSAHKASRGPRGKSPGRPGE
jgi:hypothetical protein